MIDKQLLRLLGRNKKYIFYTVGAMVLGLFANLTITASICKGIQMTAQYQAGQSRAGFVWAAGFALLGVGVRYLTSRLAGR